MTKVKLKIYEYPLTSKAGYHYTGMYTIKEGIAPLGYKEEKLVQELETWVKA